MAIFAGLLLGIGAIGLGAKAFGRSGLPLPMKNRLQGMPAQIVGVLCVLLGAGMLRYWVGELLDSLVLQVA